MKIRFRKLWVASLAAFLFMSGQAVNAIECQLIFEVVPSKDAAATPGVDPIIMSRLATKNFGDWNVFTGGMIETVDDFLITTFGRNFTRIKKPLKRQGGFEGRTSPNLIIPFDANVLPGALTALLNSIASAVGWIYIQDGTVITCEGEVTIGQKIEAYRIKKGTNFQSRSPKDFAFFAYSALLLGNRQAGRKSKEIGYTLLEDETMQVLQIEGGIKVKAAIEEANAYLADALGLKDALEAEAKGSVHSVLLDNDWVKLPNGQNLLQHLNPEQISAIQPLRAKYIAELVKFAEAQ